MKKLPLLLGLFFALLALNGHSQTMDRSYFEEDFNYLCKVIQHTNPQLSLRKKVTGWDILEQLRSLKSELDTITQVESFWRFTYKALNLCQDPHFSVTIPSVAQPNIDSAIMARNESIIVSALEKEELPSNLHVFKYENGKYYFFVDLENTSDGQTEIVHVGDQLLEIDRIPVDDYMLNVHQYQFSSTGWDKKQGKFYSTRGFEIPNSFTVRSLSDGTIKTIPRGRLSLNNASATVNSPLVRYFEDTKILFIRVPEMETRFIDYYSTEIQKFAKNTRIDKIVIDVRGNGGGNDQVWHSLLSSMIKDPLTYRQKLLLRNTPFMRDYYELIQHESLDKEATIEIPFLDHESYIVLDDGGGEQILPAKNSLLFSGKIYLLVDEQCFSSTLSLLEVAHQNRDRFVSIGSLGGYLGGQGGTPFVFVLPNTKICFQMNVMLDYYGVEKVSDFFRNEIMYPVEPSVQEYHECTLTEEGRYDAAFLYHKDPHFKKVMLLK